MFTLSPLPFSPDSLAPHISAKTLEFHYGKHHQAYVDNLNKLIAGTDLEGKSLLEIINQSLSLENGQAIFNNAAQVYNHDFFWASLKPGTAPTGEMLELLNKSFGSFENFKKEFVAAAISQFGSGWAWLVKEGDSLKIVKTGNAQMPDLSVVKPLLNLDVWEHSYYLDYQNRRPDYVSAIVDNLLNWDFAQANLS